MAIYHRISSTALTLGAEKQVALMEDPFVLLYDKKISNIRDLLPAEMLSLRPRSRLSTWCRDS
jgi:chaperonin GroEL (HSP60 family)